MTRYMLLVSGRHQCLAIISKYAEGVYTPIFNRTLHFSLTLHFYKTINPPIRVSNKGWGCGRIVPSLTGPAEDKQEIKEGLGEEVMG